MKKSNMNKRSGQFIGQSLWQFVELGLQNILARENDDRKKAKIMDVCMINATIERFFLSCCFPLILIAVVDKRVGG